MKHTNLHWKFSTPEKSRLQAGFPTTEETWPHKSSRQISTYVSCERRLLQALLNLSKNHLMKHHPQDLWMPRLHHSFLLFISLFLLFGTWSTIVVVISLMFLCNVKSEPSLLLSFVIIIITTIILLLLLPLIILRHSCYRCLCHPDRLVRPRRRCAHGLHQCLNLLHINLHVHLLLLHHHDLPCHHILHPNLPHQDDNHF